MNKVCVMCYQDVSSFETTHNYYLIHCTKCGMYALHVLPPVGPATHRFGVYRFDMYDGVPSAIARDT